MRRSWRVGYFLAFEDRPVSLFDEALAALALEPAQQLLEASLRKVALASERRVFSTQLRDDLFRGLLLVDGQRIRHYVRDGSFGRVDWSFL